MRCVEYGDSVCKSDTPSLGSSFETDHKLTEAKVGAVMCVVLVVASGAPVEMTENTTAVLVDSLNLDKMDGPSKKIKVPMKGDPSGKPP